MVYAIGNREQGSVDCTVKNAQLPCCLDAVLSALGLHWMSTILEAFPRCLMSAHRGEGAHIIALV